MAPSSLSRLSKSSSPSYPVNERHGEHTTGSGASSDISDSDSTTTNRGVTSTTSTKADEDSLLTPASSMSTSGYNINGNGAKEDSVASGSAAPTSKTTTPPSYQSIYSSSPSITYPYSPAEALGDLPGIAYALELFLSSQMLESEAFCMWGHSGLEEPQKQEGIKDAKVKSATELEDKGHMERLYFATGYGLIQCVKGLMSFEDDVCVIFFWPRPLFSLHVGPPCGHCSHKARQRHCIRAPQKGSLLRLSPRRLRGLHNPLRGLSILHQEYDRCREARGVSLRREFVREGASGDRVFGRLVGFHQGSVSAVLSPLFSDLFAIVSLSEAMIRSFQFT